MNETELLTHKNAEIILEEGWKLFQQKGYRGVSIDELCARCQITKPTLYYYFQDKETLFVQVLAYKLKHLHKATELAEPFQGRLQALALAVFESFFSPYAILLHDREHLKNPENLQKIKTVFYEEMFNPLKALMQSGIDEGLLKQEDPEFYTLLFLGMLNNFIGKAAEQQATHARLAKKITDYFIKGAINE